MDQVKTGKFLAELRKQAGLTQEELGERLGVTNKTVSRWENGNYMPDIQMFEMLSREYGVSIHELLAGQRLSDEAFRRVADENLVAACAESSFTMEERRTWLIEKWRKDHRFLFVLMALGLLMLAAWAVVRRSPFLLGLTPVLALIGYGWQNNRMMIYVEGHLYGDGNS